MIFDQKEPVSAPGNIADNGPTVSNVRLWRPEILQENFQSLQRIKQFYDFKDVDVDRYPIQNQERVLMVSVSDARSAPARLKRWTISRVSCVFRARRSSL